MSRPVVISSGKFVRRRPETVARQIVIISADQRIEPFEQLRYIPIEFPEDSIDKLFVFPREFPVIPYFKRGHRRKREIKYFVSVNKVPSHEEEVFLPDFKYGMFPVAPGEPVPHPVYGVDKNAKAQRCFSSVDIWSSDASEYFSLWSMICESPRDVTSPMKMKFGFAVDIRSSREYRGTERLIELYPSE